MKTYSNGADSIVPYWINEYFKITMNDQEIQLAQEAIQELKTSGLMVKDGTQREEVFQVLTQKGKTLVEKSQDPDVHALRLEEVLRNQDLLEVSLDPFNEGDYETAIFKAFRFVEEQVRAKSGLGAGDIGVDLMTKAFNPTKGLLEVPTCAVPAEQEGIMSLFRGAISLFKNPSSHRTVNYNDRIIAIQTIGFAELLLDILSKATLRP
jgi:uncharacterized protein (TIGR02391 family)